MAEEKVKQPIYKKWWFWLIIVIVVLAVIGSVLGAGETKNDSNTDSSTKQEDTNMTEQEDSNTDSDNKKISAYYIGDTVTAGNLEFTVNSVSDTNLLGSSLVGESTENNFIVISITIKNIGNTEVSLTSSYLTLKRGNTEYSVNSASIYLENGFYVVQDIGVGITKTISVAYETPDRSTDSTYVLKVGTLLKNAEITLQNN